MSHLRSHGKHMLLGGTGIVALMMLLGVSWQQAVTWGILLACPVGMIVMMRFMGRGDAHRHGDVHGAAGEPDLPQQRVGESLPRDRRPGAR